MTHYSKTFCLLVIGLLSFQPASVWSQTSGSKPEMDFISGDAIQLDLDSLRQWVLDMHPAPFTNCTETEFKAAYEAASGMYDGGGSRMAAAQAFARFLNVMKDSHSCVSLKSLSEKLAQVHGVFPIEVTTVENRIFTLVDASGRIPTGTEIKMVAGKSARSVLGMALPLVAQEGDAQVARLRLADKLWNDLVPILSHSQPGDSIELFITDSLGARVMVPLLHPDLILHRRKDQSPVHWSFQTENHGVTAILTISSFQPHRKNRYIRELKNGFKVLKNVNREESKPLIGLIIDLRGNAGGHVSLMEELVPYISSQPVLLPHAVQIRQSQHTYDQFRARAFYWPVRKKSEKWEMAHFVKALRTTPVDSTAEVLFAQASMPHKRLLYQGPIALIMDGLSASASVSMASWFVQSARGKTFGEPPMGSASGTFGNPYQRTLPETGIGVNIATARYFTSASRIWESRPLLPDFPVSWGIHDLINGNDPVKDVAKMWLLERP